MKPFCYWMFMYCSAFETESFTNGGSDPAEAARPVGWGGTDDDLLPWLVILNFGRHRSPCGPIHHTCLHELWSKLWNWWIEIASHRLSSPVGISWKQKLFQLKKGDCCFYREQSQPVAIYQHQTTARGMFWCLWPVWPAGFKNSPWESDRQRWAAAKTTRIRFLLHVRMSTRRKGAYETTSCDTVSDRIIEADACLLHIRSRCHHTWFLPCTELCCVCCYH